MLSKKIVIGIFLFSILIVILVFLYDRLLIKIYTPPENGKITGEEVQEEGRIFEIVYSYSDCIPYNGIEEFERLFNITNYTIKGRNIFITTYFYSYEKIDKVEMNYSVIPHPFSGNSLRVGIYEYPGESILEHERGYIIFKCLRIWNVELHNIPENVTYVYLDHFRYWKETTYWGGKTIEINIS